MKILISQPIMPSWEAGKFLFFLRQFFSLTVNKATLKKSLFPVQQVAEIKAAAKSFFFGGGGGGGVRK